MPCLKLIASIAVIGLCLYALCKLFKKDCVFKNCDEEEFEADAHTVPEEVKK